MDSEIIITIVIALNHSKEGTTSAESHTHFFSDFSNSSTCLYHTIFLL